MEADDLGAEMSSVVGLGWLVEIVKVEAEEDDDDEDFEERRESRMGEKSSGVRGEGKGRREESRREGREGREESSTEMAAQSATTCCRDEAAVDSGEPLTRAKWPARDGSSEAAAPRAP